jgi:hypothetical protein
MSCRNCQTAREAAGRARDAALRFDARETLNAATEAAIAAAHAIGDKAGEALRIRRITGRR